jgi:hypothetical protein
MEPDIEYDESKDCKPHLNGTLLSIFWPEHGLATVKKCPLASEKAAATEQIVCLCCRHFRGFFSPGRHITDTPIEISGHNRVMFQQVICEHPAVRRKSGESEGDRREFSPRAGMRELAAKRRNNA